MMRGLNNRYSRKAQVATLRARKGLERKKVRPGRRTIKMFRFVSPTYQNNSKF